VCRPLSVPAVSTAYDSGWGSLSFDAGFAIASGTGGAYLERCGSRLHEFLTFTAPASGDCPHLACAPVSNSREIIWQSASGRLSGIFLPNRQRFTIPVPENVDPLAGGFANDHLYTLALTSTRLYLLTPENGIWSTPAPPSPSSTSHRHG